MKYSLLLSLFLVTLPAFADDARDDAQYAVYMGDAGVFAMKLQIRIGGLNAHANFEKHVDDLMASIDANVDGVVSATEAEGKYLTPAAAVAAQIVTAPNGKIPTVAPDANKDGKITRQEFLDYFRRIGMQAFSISYQPRMMPTAGNRRARPTGVVNELPLFSKLDTNVDGKLSAEELRSALVTLHKLDLDGDETISAAELSPIGNNLAAQANGQPAALGPFLGVGSDESLPKQLRRLIEKYDQNNSKNNSENVKQKLSRHELGLTESAFAKLDQDGNGQLDSEELRQFLTGPESAISVSVDLNSRDQLVVEVEQESLRDKLRITSDGAANINLNTTLLSISRGPAFNFSTAESLVKGQFKAVDRDANGYLEKSETEQSYLYGATFEDLDADKNGKVFVEEMLAYFKLRFEAAQSKTVLMICEQGRTLFEVLDANRDRRLSFRELKNAADHLALWDSDGDGLLSETEVPMQYRLMIVRGNLNVFGGNYGMFNRMDVAANQSDTSSGPTWFSRMDKNRDGEVSQREFLGDVSIFKNLDQNQDGFIDLAESVQTIVEKQSASQRVE